MPQTLKFYAREWNVKQSQSYEDPGDSYLKAKEFETGKFSNQLMYTEDEVKGLLHKKWMDTIHEMQRVGELKRKAIYEFIDAIESQTNNWDVLCDCGCDGEADEKEYRHNKDCMTMNARHDAEQLLKKFEDRE